MNWLLYIGFNFILYSFIGWIIEEVYAFFITGDFQEDGFLNGPFKPMYGITVAIIAHSYNRFNLRGFLLLAVVLLVPTVVEYISGYGLLKFYEKEYWSYKNFRFNYNGIVCLRFSFYWSVLSLFGVYALLPITTFMFFEYQYMVVILIPSLLIYLMFDLVKTIQSVKVTHLKSRDS